MRQRGADRAGGGRSAAPPIVCLAYEARCRGAFRRRHRFLDRPAPSVITHVTRNMNNYNEEAEVQWSSLFFTTRLHISTVKMIAPRLTR